MFVKRQKSQCASQGGAVHENHLQVCQLPVGLRLWPLLSSQCFPILMSVLGSKVVGKLERGVGHSVWTQVRSTELSCFPQSRPLKPPSNGKPACSESVLWTSSYMIYKSLTELCTYVFGKPVHKYLLAYSSKRKNAGVLRMRCSIICLWKNKPSNRKPLMAFNVGEWRLRALGTHRICNLKITITTEERRLKGLNIWQHQIGNYSALIYRIINSNFD